jgi:hypothetical protein
MNSGQAIEKCQPTMSLARRRTGRPDVAAIMA